MDNSTTENNIMGNQEILRFLMGMEDRTNKRFDHMQTHLEQKIEDVRTELKAEIQDVRTEIQDVRAELKEIGRAHV